ncbi:hypothetical protein N0V84_010416 [Fusarium piperis]|uniref:Uncharacterized protein n=1 Tax=Fusarium piperis TaxID=1435070 RepID=A0A9W8W4K7_9HYPO|nr:hypothetical protein N0V84_010416 [Fusarium piperis]
MSTIDVRGEHIIQEALNKTSLDRANTIIASRLLTIKHTDHIAVLNKGKAFESGTHETVMGQSSYAWMFPRSIDLFKHQDDHFKIMDEVDFISIMWAVFAASPATAYYLNILSSGRVASFNQAKYHTQYFSSQIFQKAPYFDEDGHFTLTTRWSVM